LSGTVAAKAEGAAGSILVVSCDGGATYTAFTVDTETDIDGYFTFADLGVGDDVKIRPVASSLTATNQPNPLPLADIIKSLAPLRRGFRASPLGATPVPR
jgi:hypothetical protein